MSVCNRGDHLADDLSEKLGLLLVYCPCYCLASLSRPLAFITGLMVAFSAETPCPGDTIWVDLGFHEFMSGNLRNDVCKQS